MSIEIKDLVKTYGEQKAVNAISFKVEKGEIVGFLGPNGAGKSTTMKILTGYLGQDSGEARICGISVNEQPWRPKGRSATCPKPTRFIRTCTFGNTWNSSLIYTRSLIRRTGSKP